MNELTAAQQEALARAASRLQDWVGFRIDDRAEDLARLYRDSRSVLAERLRYVYDSFLAGEPSVAAARATGADVALKQAIDVTIDELTNQVGAEATTSIQSLLGGQPEAVNRYLGKYLELPAAGAAYDLNPRWVLQELSTSVIGGGTYFDRLLNIGENMKSDLTKIVRQGLISGTDFDTIRDRTMTAFGVDKLPEPKFNAYGSVQTYKNEARRQWNLLMDDTGDEVGAMKIWWCILDDATTPGCAARHGYPTSRVGDDLPRHFNCRCQIVLMAEGTDLTPFQALGDAWLQANGYPSRTKALAMEAWSPEDHPRDEEGQFTAAGGGVPEEAKEFQTPLRDAYGSVLVRGDIALSTGQGDIARHVKLYDALGYGTDYAAQNAAWRDGWVRATTSAHGGDLQIAGILTPASVDTMRRIIGAHGKNASVTIDLIDPKTGTQFLAAKQGMRVGEALRWLDEQTSKREAWNPDEHPRDPNGRFSVSGAPALHTIHEWVTDAGARFDGVQEFPSLRSGHRAPDYATFTDKKTGSTALLPIDKDLTPETIKLKLEKMRKTFHKETEAVQWGEHRLTLLACEEAETVEAWDADYRGSAAWRYQVVPWRALPQLVRTGVTGAFSAPSLLEAYRRSDPSSVVLRFPQVPGPTPARRVHVLAEAGWVPLQPKGATWVEIRPGEWIADSPSWTRWQEAAVRLSPDVIEDFPQLGSLALRAAPPYRVSVQAGSPAGPNPDTWPTGTDSGPNLPALVDAALAAPLPADPLLGISDRNGLAVVVGLNGRVWYARDSFQGLGLSTYTRVAAYCPGEEPGTVWAVRPVGHGQWVLPGGHIDKGESQMDAVVREMREETGLHTEVVRFLGSIHRPWATTHVYLVRSSDHGRDKPSTPDEIAAVRIVSLDDLDPSERVWLVQQDLTQEAWDPADHPRDKDGKFSDIGDEAMAAKTPDALGALHDRIKVHGADRFDDEAPQAEYLSFIRERARNVSQLASAMGAYLYEQGKIDAPMTPGAEDKETFGQALGRAKDQLKSVLGRKSDSDEEDTEEALQTLHWMIGRLGGKTQEAWDPADHPRDEEGQFSAGAGSPAAFGRMNKEDIPGDGSTSGPPGEHLFHTTSKDNLQDIVSGGLTPQDPAYRGEQDAWPDGGDEPRVYFSTRAAGTLKFSEPDHVLLRVKKPDKLRAEFRDEDYYARKTVRPEDIEVLGEDKQWHPLTTRKQEAWDEEAHPREPAGEEGGGQFTAAGGGVGPMELPEDQRASMQKKFAKRLGDKSSHRGLDNDTVLYAFGAPLRAENQSPETWALADHIAKATDDDTMLNVLHSQNTWSLNWVGATREWRAADAAGGNGTYSRGTKDAFEDPERFTSEERKKTRPLEAKEQKAFEARRQFVQEYFRKKYGDEVTVYRGIRGPQAKKIKENYGAKDEIDLPVYGLSSWSVSPGAASDFAMTGKASRQKFTGVVVKTTIKPEDVWLLPREVGPTDVIRFSEDRGEIVTLNKNKTRKVTFA